MTDLHWIFCMLPLAVTRSFAVGVATSYVLLLLWMTSWLHIMGRNRRHKKAVGLLKVTQKGRTELTSRRLFELAYQKATLDPYVVWYLRLSYIRVDIFTLAIVIWFVDGVEQTYSWVQFTKPNPTHHLLTNPNPTHNRTRTLTLITLRQNTSKSHDNVERSSVSS